MYVKWIATWLLFLILTGIYDKYYHQHKPVSIFMSMCPV